MLSKKPDASFSATTVSFMYTATGQRPSMMDASGVTNYTYSNRAQVVQKATERRVGDFVEHESDQCVVRSGCGQPAVRVMDKVTGGADGVAGTDSGLLTTDTYDANGNTVSSDGTNHTYGFEDRLLSTSSDPHTAVIKTVKDICKALN